MVKLDGELLGSMDTQMMNKKNETWTLLQSLKMDNIPWVCFGDFNEILGQHVMHKLKENSSLSTV